MTMQGTFNQSQIVFTSIPKYKWIHFVKLNGAIPQMWTLKWVKLLSPCNTVKKLSLQWIGDNPGASLAKSEAGSYSWTNTWYLLQVCAFGECFSSPEIEPLWLCCVTSRPLARPDSPRPQPLPTSPLFPWTPEELGSVAITLCTVCAAQTAWQWWKGFFFF